MNFSSWIRVANVGSASALALVMSSASLGACGRRQARTETVAVVTDAFGPRNVLLAEPQEDAALRAAIIRALQDRGYVTEQEAGNTISARYTSRGSTVRINVSYAATQVTIQYVDSSGLDITPQGSSRTYDRWMQNLESSIREQLGRAPEAAPAAVQPSNPTPPPTLAIFDSPQRADQIHAVLQRALSQHGWVIEQDLGTSVIARLDHRAGRLRVQIGFDERQANIQYLDSQGLDIDERGHSDEYERWMRNLVSSIRDNTRR